MALSASPTSAAASRPFGAWHPLPGAAYALPAYRRLDSRPGTLWAGRPPSAPGASLSPASAVTSAPAAPSGALKAKKRAAEPLSGGKGTMPSSSQASATRRSAGQPGAAGRKRSSPRLPTTSPKRRRKSRAKPKTEIPKDDAEEDEGDEEPAVAKRPAAAPATRPTAPRPSQAAPVRPGRRSTTAKATEARQARQQARVTRAAKRRPAASSTDPSTPVVLTVPEEFSVSAEQMATYNAEAGEFLGWLKHSGLAKTSELKDEAVLDAMTVQYLATLFDEGESYATAAAVVFGLVFRFGPPKSRTVLPRSRRALLCFREDDPEVSRDPCPEEAAVLLVDDLLLQDASTMGGDLACLMATSAIALQMDLTSRPSETLALTREKVVPPQGKKIARIAVIFRPQDATRSQTTKVTNKSGSVDDTVMSAACGTKSHVFTQVLSALHVAARPRERLLSPLTLAACERIVHASAGRCGFEALNIVPLSFRH